MILKQAKNSDHTWFIQYPYPDIEGFQREYPVLCNLLIIRNTSRWIALESNDQSRILKVALKLAEYHNCTLEIE